MPAWLLPALFAGASALFGGISKKKQRDEENRQRQQAWSDYQSKYRSYIDAQNRKRAVFKWYADKNGWQDRLGPLYDQIFTPMGYDSVPGGSAPQVKGSFLGDTLGSALGAVPGYMATFRSQQAPNIDQNLLNGLLRAFGIGGGSQYNNTGGAPSSGYAGGYTPSNRASWPG